MPPAPRSFDRSSTSDQVLAGIDLAGRTSLVTGASSGLGAESARALAARGARVVMTGRDLAKTGRVADRIRRSTGNESVEVMELHLERPASVRAFAKAFLARHRELHHLIGNAGVMACPLLRTAEGWELQFATNHLGHFLLTALLAPALRAAGGAEAHCAPRGSSPVSACSRSSGSNSWRRIAGNRHSPARSVCRSSRSASVRMPVGQAASRSCTR